MDEGNKIFGDWMRGKQWEEAGDQDPTALVEELERDFATAMNKSYEYKTRKKKTSEPPWMSEWLRDLIEDRRRVFKTDGNRSPRWKILKARIERKVEKRKKKYHEFVIAKFKGSTDPSNFYKLVNSLLGKNQKPRWSPSELYPDLPDKEAAEKLADYFNSISNEYSPLDMAAVLATPIREPDNTERIPVISIDDVVKKFSNAKLKPSSVPGDIPHVLYKQYPELLARPAKIIFNQIARVKKWPRQWSTEHVTIIPKNQAPTDPSECRNISCSFLSKIMESFILEWAREQVTPSLNQYGGEPEASSTQMLIELVDYVT